jgi:hypothetical protein
MGFIWMHIFHLPRAYLGIRILSQMPKSHDFIDEIRIKEDEKMKFEEMKQTIKDSMQ